MGQVNCPVFDLSLHQIVIRAGASLIVLSLHGLALAAIARVLGDRGPQFDGRLSASPIRQLDAVGTATAILFQLGWIRPMAIDPAQLRWGRLGLVVCVLGSIAATLIAVTLLLRLRTSALIYMPSAFVPTVLAILNESAESCSWFVALNVLPLPPLTGMHLLVAIRPSLAPVMMKYQRYAGLAIAALTLAGIVRPALQPLKDIVALLFPGL